MISQAMTHSAAWTAAAWTMIHYLWIGAAMGATALICRRLLTRVSPRLRYFVALAWLALLSAAPVAIVAWMTMQSPAVAPSLSQPVMIAAVADIAPQASDVMTEDRPSEPSLNGPITVSNPISTTPSPWERLIVALPWLWLIGAALTLTWSLAGLASAERLRRMSREAADPQLLSLCDRLAKSLAISRRVAVALCERVASPVLIGIVRPVILLPPALLSGLSAQQLEMVLLHELAHVKRWDNLVNLLQRIVESLLFFQPAVWVVSGWVRQERELCCDDIVLDDLVLGGQRDAGAYAEMLLRVADMIRGGGSWPTVASAAGGSGLAARIRRLLGKPETMRVSRPLAIAIASVLIIGIAGACSLALAEAKADVPGEGEVLIAGRDAKYQKIQEAIDAAPEGATVRVGPGKYLEGIRITKPIVLEGSGWEATTIVVPARKGAAVDEAVKQAEEDARSGKTDAELTAALAKLRDKFLIPAVLIEGAKGVEIRGVRITSEVPTLRGSKEYLMALSLVNVNNAQATISECAVLGSPGTGITIADGSDVKILKSLVGGVWNVGIMIGSKTGKPVKALVADCDIRNCYYTAIIVAANVDRPTIERCRISGTGWHGIRYRGAPIVRDNLIFKIARCGIYSDENPGATVEGNVFMRNETTGIWCLDENKDRIVGNVFAFNKDSGLSVSGGGQPIVEQNIFYGNEAGVELGTVNSKKPKSDMLGDPKLAKNVFWKNGMTVAAWGPATKPNTVGTKTEVPQDAKTQSIVADPKFVNPEAGDFAVAGDSPAKAAGAGVKKQLAMQSPWALQPEEKAIIPDGPSYDYQGWKKVSEK